MYEPRNALQAPRFTGPRTFARLPMVTNLDGVDVAVSGMPWDGGTSFRSGTRFRPKAIRSASGMVRTYNPVQRVQVFGARSCFGDARPPLDTSRRRCGESRRSRRRSRGRACPVWASAAATP